MKRILAALTIILLGTGMALAQATFSTSTEAVGLHYNGAWGVANHTTESLDFLDWGAQKGNSLDVEGHEIMATTAGFSSYLGGVRITPDISNILKKTNVSPDQFGVFAQSAVGVTTLPASNNITFLLGGGAMYRLTTNLSWATVDARWGKIGSQPFYEVSSGLTYIFNPQTAKSLSAKRFMAKRAKAL